MRRTAGYSSLDRRRNEDILEELKVDPAGKKLAQYKQKWLNNVSRIEALRYPKLLLDSRPVGRRRGPPLKRGCWTDTIVRWKHFIYWLNFVNRRRPVFCFLNFCGVFVTSEHTTSASEISILTCLHQAVSGHV